MCSWTWDIPQWLWFAGALNSCLLSGILRGSWEGLGEKPPSQHTRLRVCKGLGPGGWWQPGGLDLLLCFWRFWRARKPVGRPRLPPVPDPSLTAAHQAFLPTLLAAPGHRQLLLPLPWSKSLKSPGLWLCKAGHSWNLPPDLGCRVWS